MKRGLPPELASRASSNGLGEFVKSAADNRGVWFNAELGGTVAQTAASVLRHIGWSATHRRVAGASMATIAVMCPEDWPSGDVEEPEGEGEGEEGPEEEDEAVARRRNTRGHPPAAL